MSARPGPLFDPGFRQLPTRVRLLLITLSIDWPGRDARASYTLRGLARRLSTSPRSVKTGLRTLERAGWIRHDDSARLVGWTEARRGWARRAKRMILGLLLDARPTSTL